MLDKFTALSPELYGYLVDHRSERDPVLAELKQETEALGPVSMMQIAPEQGALMTILTRVLGVRKAIEIGTFTGYSALAIARGLPADGKLICCDISAEWTAIAQRYWEKAGVADRIELRIGPALDTLRALPGEPEIDLAFIDADKTSYRSYYEELLPRLRPNGLLLFDNVLWSGQVIDSTTSDESTIALRELNDFIRDDGRVEAVMLAISDGLTIVRKRAADE